MILSQNSFVNAYSAIWGDFLNKLYDKAQIAFLQINPPKIEDPSFDQWLFINLSLVQQSGLFRSVAKWIEDKELFDQIKQIIKSSNLNYHLYRELGKLARVIHAYEDSISLYQNALSCSDSIEDKLKCEMNIANLSIAQGLFAAAIKQFTNLRTQDLSQFPVLKALVDMNYASALYQTGQVDGATSIYLDVLEDFIKLGEHKREGQIHFNLAVIDLNKGEFKKSKDRFQLAYTAYENAKNTRGLVISTEYIVKILLNQNDKKAAIEKLEHIILKISWKEDHKLYSRIGVQYVTLLHEKKNYEKIKSHFNHLLSTILTKDEPVETYQMFFSITRAYIEMESNLEEVELLLSQLLTIAIEKNDLESKIELHLSYIHLYGKLRKLNEGLEHIKNLTEIIKSSKNFTSSIVSQIKLEIIIFFHIIHSDDSETHFVEYLRKMEMYDWQMPDQRISSTTQMLGIIVCKEKKILKSKKWQKMIANLESLLLPKSHLFVLHALLHNLIKLENSLHYDESKNSGELLRSLGDELQVPKEQIMNILKSDISWVEINLMLEMLQK